MSRRARPHYRPRLRLDFGRRVWRHAHPAGSACSGVHLRSVLRFASGFFPTRPHGASSGVSRRQSPRAVASGSRLLPTRPAKDFHLQSSAHARHTSPRATIGEGDHRRVLGAPNGVEFAADQRFDSRIGFRDGAENLPATSLRFDIADLHLKMPLRILTAADEGRVQGDHDRRRRRSRLDRGTLNKSLTGFQGMAAQGLRVLRGVQREYLLQQVSRCPIL